MKIDCRMPWRLLLSLVAALTWGLSSAQADTTIKLLVGFPPGGGTDAIARLLGDKLKDHVSYRIRRSRKHVSLSSKMATQDQAD